MNYRRDLIVHKTRSGEIMHFIMVHNWLSPHQSFFAILSRSELIMRAIIENMILPDYVLCYVPQVLGNFGKQLNILEFLFGKFENFDFFWKSRDMTSKVRGKLLRWDYLTRPKKSSSASNG